MQREQNQLIKFIDYFLGDHFTDDTDKQHSARQVICVLLALSIVLTMSTLYFIFFSGVHALSILMGGVICQTVAFSLIGVLIYLRSSGNYRRAVNISLAVMNICLFFGLYVSGGPATSPVLLLLYVPIVLSFFLLGQYYGLFWTTLILLCVAVFVFADDSGFKFVNTIDKSHATETRVIIFFVGFFAVLGLVFAYEYTNRELRYERDLEHQRYVFLANHDKLTALANRSKFEEVVRETLTWYEYRKPGPFVALLCLDLDGFKPINDDYGHHAGDQVLCTIAQRLSAQLRETDIVSRHGGDEFMMMLNHISGPQVIEPIVKKLLNEIQKPIDVGLANVSVTGSVGVALYPKHSREVDRLMIYADKAMYQAKRKKVGWVMYRGDGV